MHYNGTLHFKVFVIFYAQPQWHLLSANGGPRLRVPHPVIKSNVAAKNQAQPISAEDERDPARALLHPIEPQRTENAEKVN
jgi:hypothetical protein